MLKSISESSCHHVHNTVNDCCDYCLNINISCRIEMNVKLFDVVQCTLVIVPLYIWRCNRWNNLALADIHKYIIHSLPYGNGAFRWDEMVFLLSLGPNSNSLAPLCWLCKKLGVRCSKVMPQDESVERLILLNDDRVRTMKHVMRYLGTNVDSNVASRNVVKILYSLSILSAIRRIA